MQLKIRNGSFIISIGLKVIPIWRVGNSMKLDYSNMIRLKLLRELKNGKEQAYNFINNVQLDSLSLPPVLDVELFGGNKFSFETKNKVISEIFNCLRTLEKYYDRKPIIYTNIETYENFIKGNFDDYDLWLCKLCNEPKTVKWKIWQYSHQGVVPGIKSDVDMNVFNGSYEEFVNYIYKK